MCSCLYMPWPHINRRYITATRPHDIRMSSVRIVYIFHSKFSASQSRYSIRTIDFERRRFEGNTYRRFSYLIPRSVAASHLLSVSFTSSLCMVTRTLDHIDISRTYRNGVYIYCKLTLPFTVLACRTTESPCSHAVDAKYPRECMHECVRLCVLTLVGVTSIIEPGVFF